MTLPPFAPNAFYRFTNEKFPHRSISTGFIYETNPPRLGLTPLGSRSSENWQLYAQNASSGYIYFIRNYDYGTNLQLGVTPLQRGVPTMLPTSGALGQQWRIVNGDGGKWVLSNMLLGPESVLGVSDGSSDSSMAGKIPAINPSPDGTEHWVVTINVSAGEAVGDMSSIQAVEDLKNVPTMEVVNAVPVLGTRTRSTVANVALWTGAGVLLVVALIFVQYAFVQMLGRLSKKDAPIYLPVAEHEDELPGYAENEYEDCEEASK